MTANEITAPVLAECSDCGDAIAIADDPAAVLDPVECIVLHRALGTILCAACRGAAIDREGKL